MLPFPRRLKPFSPDSQPFTARLLFLGPVSSAAVLGVIDSPSPPDHRQIQLVAVGAAHGHDTAVAVIILPFALHPPMVRQLSQDGRRILAAFINIAVLTQAGLLPFGRVDPPKPDPRISNRDRVAVDDARVSGEIGCAGRMAEPHKSERDDPSPCGCHS